MCNQALERAIDRKALHKTQLLGAILNRLKEIKPANEEDKMSSSQQPSNNILSKHKETNQPKLMAPRSIRCF